MPARDLLHVNGARDLFPIPYGAISSMMEVSNVYSCDLVYRFVMTNACTHKSLTKSNKDNIPKRIWFQIILEGIMYNILVV